MPVEPVAPKSKRPTRPYIAPGLKANLFGEEPIIEESFDEMASHQSFLDALNQWRGTKRDEKGEAINETHSLDCQTTSEKVELKVEFTQNMSYFERLMLNNLKILENNSSMSSARQVQNTHKIAHETPESTDLSIGIKDELRVDDSDKGQGIEEEELTEIANQESVVTEISNQEWIVTEIANEEQEISALLKSGVMVEIIPSNKVFIVE